MALQFNMTLDSGLAVSNAYARISGVTVLHKQDDIQIVLVEFYASKAAWEDGKVQMFARNYDAPYDDSGSLTLAELYTWLKTLPDFANATDC